MCRPNLPEPCDTECAQVLMETFRLYWAESCKCHCSLCQLQVGGYQLRLSWYWFLCSWGNLCPFTIILKLVLMGFVWEYGCPSEFLLTVTLNLLKPTGHVMHQHFTFNNCTFCPHCIYLFCIYLRTNSDLCHLQHKVFGFYNRDEKCLLRGTNWVFK